MGKYNLKIGIFSKKTGNVVDQDVYDSKGVCIGKYSGEIKDGVFQGHGILALKDETSYEGDWKNGLKNGKGLFKAKIIKETDPNSSISDKDVNIITYEGDFANDEFEGEGRIEIKNGVKHWAYRYSENPPIMNSVIIYEGEWVKGYKDGYGELKRNFSTPDDTFKNKDFFYKGEFKKDKKNGEGILLSKIDDRNNRGKYDGEFINDIFVKGIYTSYNWKNEETKYEYEIDEENRYIGNTKVITKDNTIYELENQGNEIDKTFYCKGKINYSWGDTFEGDFFDFRMTNLEFMNVTNLERPYIKGILKNADGTLITRGTWQSRELNGKAELIWSNGDNFVGNYVEGVRKSGVMKWSDGQKYNGGFEGDDRNGFGRMDYSDGSYFEGNWKKNKEHGEGKLFDSNGFIQKMGNWVDGDFIDITQSDRISLD